MSYFDSAKNRVLWLDELTKLKQMKDSYEKTGIDPFKERAAPAAETATAGRTPVRFSTLEREEEKEMEQARLMRDRDFAKRKERNARRLREKEEKEKLLEREREKEKDRIQDPLLGDKKRSRGR